MYKDFPTTNYAYGILTAGILSTDGSMTLETGYISKFPDPAVSGEYNVIVYNATDYTSPLEAYWANDARILGVVSITADTMFIRQPNAGNDYNNEDSSNTAINLNTTGKTYNVILAPTSGLLDKIKASKVAITVGMAGYDFEPSDYLCDGIDDDVQIQEALIKANGTNGLRNVIIKPGTYQISHSLEKYRSSIEGLDAQTTILQWNGPDDTWMFNNINNDSFVIKNITLDGVDNTNGVTLVKPGSNADKVTLERVFFKNSGIGLNTGENTFYTVSRKRESGVATIVTSQPHGLINTQTVDISGVTGADYDSTGNAVTVVNSTTFTYVNAGADEATTADTGGTVVPTTQNFWDSAIRDCYFSNCGIGIIFGEFGFRVNTSIISGCDIGIQMEANSDANFNQCTFTGNGVDIFVNNHCSAMAFRDCWFEESTSRIIDANPLQTSVAKMIVFDNCHLHTHATAGSIMDYTYIEAMVEIRDSVFAESAGPTTTTVTDGTHSTVSYHNTQHIATGTGIISYPGIFKLKNSIESALDTDTIHKFGRAGLGYQGSYADYACFGHIDYMATGGLAITQNSGGDTTVRSGADLVLQAGGANSIVNIATTGINPSANDTFYIGKNDDDSPLAWKGVILKDTTNGKYYRVEVINGVVSATDLTD